jgi:hypothetical protein
MKLTPPDIQQCQAEKPNGNSFMTLGGATGRVRCTALPEVIVKETKKGEDGLRGSMSLCAECLEVAKKQLGETTFKVTRIKFPSLSKTQLTQLRFIARRQDFLNQWALPAPSARATTLDALIELGVLEVMPLQGEPKLLAYRPTPRGHFVLAAEKNKPHEEVRNEVRLPADKTTGQAFEAERDRILKKRKKAPRKKS